MIGLTKAVAADFVRQGIRANAICPGTIDSPSLEDRIQERSQTTGKTIAEVERAFIERQPMGRLQARGGRGARRFSRLRRGQLHHRAAASGGRRHGAVTTARLIIRRSRPIGASIVPAIGDCLCERQWRLENPSFPVGTIAKSMSYFLITCVFAHLP